MAFKSGNVKCPSCQLDFNVHHWALLGFTRFCQIPRLSLGLTGYFQCCICLQWVFMFSNVSFFNRIVNDGLFFFYWVLLGFDLEQTGCVHRRPASRFDSALPVRKLKRYFLFLNPSFLLFRFERGQRTGWKPWHRGVQKLRSNRCHESTFIRGTRRKGGARFMFNFKKIHLSNFLKNHQQWDNPIDGCIMGSGWFRDGFSQVSLVFTGFYRVLLSFLGFVGFYCL